MEAITSFGWTVIPHPPYSPDLAPPDYYLFGPKKEGLRGIRYRNDYKVKTAVLNWLRHQPAEFYNTGIHALVHRWTVALEESVDYVEKQTCNPHTCTFLLMYNTCCYCNLFVHNKVGCITF